MAHPALKAVAALDEGDMHSSLHSHHLALLIAAPQPGDAAMYRDLTAMAQTLQGRGFSADQILCRHGRLDRPLVLAFLRAASRRVIAWADGSVFLHVSSHGFFTGNAEAEARPGVIFDATDAVTDEYHLVLPHHSLRQSLDISDTANVAQAAKIAPAAVGKRGNQSPGCCVSQKCLLHRSCQGQGRFPKAALCLPDTGAF